MRFFSRFAVILLTVCSVDYRWKSQLRKEIADVRWRHAYLFADAWTDPSRKSDVDTQRQLDSGQPAADSQEALLDDSMVVDSYLPLSPSSSSSSSAARLRHRHSLNHMRQLLLSSSTNKIIDFEHGRFMSAEDQLLYGWSTGPAPNETIANYVSRNCSSCLLREEAKLARIERVKADLLSKLGMKRPPNATAVQLPPFIPHLNGLLTKWGFNAAGNPLMAGDAPYTPRLDLMADDDDSAKTEQIYALANIPPPSLNLETKEKDVAYFSFSAETVNSNILAAYLHFYVAPSPTKAGKSGVKPLLQRIHLYRVDNRHGKETLLDKKEYKRAMLSQGFWDKFEVTALVQHWFTKPERNFGLVVRATEKDIGVVVHPNLGKKNDKHSMYLNIAVEDKRNNRRKRETAPKTDCQEGENYFKCCRYPLVIDFESFGWDWVIAPKKYLAYYCSGECPFRHLQRYLHTHLLQQARPDGNAGPCCYPTNMSPILMVYFNDNKEVLVSKIPGMVVSRCGCA